MNDMSVYNLLRPDMKTGDLIEWHGNSVLDRMIRLRTGEDVNHSSLVVTLESPYCGHRVLLFEALSDGIDITFASQRLSIADGQAYYYKIREEFIPLIPSIEETAFSYVGVPYDYISILKQLIGHTHIEKNRIFCSEFVEITHGGQEGDDAYVPGELPNKMQHWHERNQLI